MLNIVVADDSELVRQVLTRRFEDHGHRVVGEAATGREVLAAVCAEKPDVVTVEPALAGADGYWVIDRIMADEPTPIVVVGGEVSAATADALGERGVVDVVTIPGENDNPNKLWMETATIVDRVTDAARTTPVTEAMSGTSRTARGEGVPTTVVVGASTGGPDVVKRILAALPGDLNARLLIVQHTSDRFTSSFAARLDAASEFEVWEAADGDSVRAGQAVVAPGGHHLVVTDYRAGTVTVALSDDPKRHNVRPAIDVTMEHAADQVDDRLVGVVLTGMGGDGADGACAIAAAGGTIIVQDETSSPVFGMPRSAIETGVVDDVIPADEIAATIVTHVRSPARKRK